MESPCLKYDEIGAARGAYRHVLGGRLRTFREALEIRSLRCKTCANSMRRSWYFVRRALIPVATDTEATKTSLAGTQEDARHAAYAYSKPSKLYVHGGPSRKRIGAPQRRRVARRRGPAADVRSGPVAVQCKWANISGVNKCVDQRHLICSLLKDDSILNHPWVILTPRR